MSRWAHYIKARADAPREIHGCIRCTGLDLEVTTFARKTKSSIPAKGNAGRWCTAWGRGRGKPSRTLLRSVAAVSTVSVRLQTMSWAIPQIYQRDIDKKICEKSSLYDANVTWNVCDVRRMKLVTESVASLHVMQRALGDYSTKLELIPKKAV